MQPSGEFILIVLNKAGTFVFDYAFGSFPQTIEQTGRANWNTQDVTIGAKPLFYANREPLRINVPELWLDSTETNESLRPQISALLALQVERYDTGVPPVLLAAWGDHQERVVLEEVTIEETFFSPEGNPLRARVSLSLVEIQDERRERVSVREVEDAPLTENTGTVNGRRPVGPQP